MAAIAIWPGTPPGTETWTHEAVAYLDPENGEPRVRNVSVPTLRPFLPDSALANGTAVIVAPGGGFEVLAVEHEGSDVCEWLAARGVAAFLLQYRLLDTGRTLDDFIQRRLTLERMRTQGVDLDEVVRVGLTFEQVLRLMPSERTFAFEDGAQAVRVVRERAGEWGVDPSRLGFLGFSAGAFVATSTALHEDVTARPDFVVPIYGGDASVGVPEDAPPMFGVVAADDWGLLDASLQVFRAWRTAGVPAELHIYAEGGHGFGMKKTGLPVDGWPQRLSEWLQSLGMTTNRTHR